MSEICTSPFHGGDRYYDIDLVKELDMDIWKASVALQESAEEEWVRKTNNKMVLYPAISIHTQSSIATLTKKP